MTRGSGGTGRLGHGDWSPQNRPRMISQVFDGEANNLISAPAFTDISATIGSANGNSMALDTAGNVWTWGWNSGGQLGHGDRVSQYRPRMVSQVYDGETDNLIPAPVFVEISSGSNYSIALDTAGNVWTWGTGELGHGERGNLSYQLRPRMISQVFDGVTDNLISAPIFINISANRVSNIALDTTGNIWTWGPLLGHGNTANTLRPRIISQVFDGVTDNLISAPIFINISAGGRHGMAIDTAGNLWTWGGATGGQVGDSPLGHGNTAIQRSPRMISQVFEGVTNYLIFAPVFINVSGGNTHNMAVDTAGNIWTWGSNGSGQLGHGNTASLTRPRMISQA
ncbi:MAG: hypothetical protein FWC80_00340 [Firmicutes bacterium]|nr:hypothetical protein [Bacillota bacterium]